MSKADGSLKVRGLPATVVSRTPPRATSLSGLWANGAVLNDPELRYATDGSPGSTGDPRTWRMTWAAIAYKIQNGSIHIVAKASGPVRGEQTVFRAEASALLFLVLHTAGNADVTLDAKGVKTRVERRSLGKTSLDLFIPIREHSERLQLHWIRSHQSLEQFCREFGRSQVWRWWANGEVDKLAGDHANQDRDLAHEAAIAASDKDTQVVQRFLAERVALLFSYDKDQGPQVFFEGEVAALSKNSRPTRLCRQDPPQVSQEDSADFACGGQKKDPTNENCFGQRWPTRPWVMLGHGPPSMKTVVGLSAPDVCLGYSKFTKEQKSSVC